MDFRYQLVDWVRGTQSLRLLRELRALQYESPEALERRNEAKLQDYLTALRAAVPRYASVKSLNELPVIDKRFINAHRGELMNSNHVGRLIRKKTGGSTGEPLVYFTGPESQSYLWAGLFLAWEAAGYRLGDKVAFLAGSSLFGSGYKQRIYYKLLNVSLFSAFDMTEQRLESYGAELSSGGHRLLYGYASAVHRLAQYLLASGRQRLTQLKAVVCTAEMLTPQMRADIEMAFGVPCFNQYGCNDAGVSAFECERREGFHLISTRCHAEVLDDGRLIATDLTNRAMFMPRYDTGDRIQLSDRRCSCGRGFPLIAEVLGRSNDLVTDPSGTSVHSEFFTHLLREDQRVESFQVLFDDSDLRINLHSKLPTEQQAALAIHYRDLVCQRLSFPRVEVVFNEPFELLPNAKHRFVMRRPDTSS